MGLKILIAAIVLAIVWSILKWAVKTVGGIWGIRDEKVSASFGIVLLGLSMYVLFKYGEQGILLFGTILTLIFFALKHFVFHSKEQFQKDDDKNYRTVSDQHDKGLSNYQISEATNLPLIYVDEAIRKIAFHKVIVAYNPPDESAEELAARFNIPVDYATKYLTWRTSGGRLPEEPTDPVIVFYFFLSGYLGLYKAYGLIEQYVHNEYLLIFACVLIFVFLTIGFVSGYTYSRNGKKIFTLFAYCLLVSLIVYQVYLLKQHKWW